MLRHESGPAGALRRRLIAQADLPAVAAVLAAAFATRTAQHWRLGLDRLGRREPPPGLPRYGVLLEADDRIVGVLVTICSAPGGDGTAAPRCHLSSWYADPAYAAQAVLLLGPLLRRDDVTLLNLTPAPHTEAILAAQGFSAYARGSRLVLPALARPRAAARNLAAAEADALPDGGLLRDHLGWGCLCLAVDTAEGPLPFVFAPAERLRGALPVSRLLYCRDHDAVAAHAGALGRALLHRGILGILTEAPLPGLPHWRVGGTQGRFRRGPLPPRPGDLSYSEFALFPPPAGRRWPRRGSALP